MQLLSSSQVTATWDCLLTEISYPDQLTPPCHAVLKKTLGTEYPEDVVGALYPRKHSPLNPSFLYTCLLFL